MSVWIAAAAVAASAFPANAIAQPRSAASDRFPSGAASCLERLRAEEQAAPDDARPRVGASCPALVAELEASVWGALDRTSTEALTADGLEALSELAGHYAVERSAPVELRRERLGDIATSLGPFSTDPEMSTWDRFMHWVKERFNVGDRLSGSWLIEWLRRLSLPADWAPTIATGIIALGALCVLAIIVNEVWWSGALRRRVRRRLGPRPAASAAEEAAFTTLESLRSLPPSRRPAVVLGVLVERLHGRFGSRFHAGLTPRELSAATAGVGLRRRAEFDQVASAVERIAYAGWEPTDGDTEKVLADGRSVLEEIESAAP